MSDITIQFRAQATKGSAYGTTPPNIPNWGASIAGTYIAQFNQNIGTSLEALLLGEVIAGSNLLGYLAVHNADATNIVELYRDSGGTHLIGRILPGMFYFGYPDANTIYAKALVAACDVNIFACQK